MYNSAFNEKAPVSHPPSPPILPYYQRLVILIICNSSVALFQIAGASAIVSVNSVHHGPLPFLVNIVFRVLAVKRDHQRRGIAESMHSAARLVPTRRARRKLILFFSTRHVRFAFITRGTIASAISRDATLFIGHRFHTNPAKQNPKISLASSSIPFEILSREFITI